jgi:hypothetical protein
MHLADCALTPAMLPERDKSTAVKDPPARYKALPSPALLFFKLEPSLNDICPPLI